MYSKSKITEVAATVADLMGIPAPGHAQAPNNIITEKAKAVLPAGDVFQRVLLYNPDAVALWLYAAYTDLLTPMLMRTELQLPMQSVMPSVTPVCFASMYSGVLPEIHGIRKYEKPVLRVDTLFDMAIRAGKKCAIVSEAEQSMAKIFLERDMGYYMYPTIDEVNAKAKELICEDQYDLIAVYNGNYDATMHRYGPESTEALSVLRKNGTDFAALIDTAHSAWAKHHVFYGFCPDHGCHEIDGGCGSHGLDMDEDMNVIHAYGWWAKQSKQS